VRKLIANFTILTSLVALALALAHHSAAMFDHTKFLPLARAIAAALYRAEHAAECPQPVADLPAR